MLTALMGVGSQLIVRYIINYKLNIESVGYFQASWQISMTYITFVLGAMAADYYPRLTQAIHNKKEANLLANDQTEIAIIFSAPVLLLMLAFAPLIINLLYSREFIDSIEILRWQVLGDVFKVISWPLGFIILAKGYRKVFFCTELLWNVSYILFVYFGIDIFGIEITGYAFAESYLIYLFTVYVVVRKGNDFQWSNNNLVLILLLTLASSSLLLLSYFSVLGAMVLGGFLVCGATVYAIKTVGELGMKSRKLEKILCIYKRLTRS
jgi:PST family polysaccharide transporter